MSQSELLSAMEPNISRLSSEMTKIKKIEENVRFGAKHRYTQEFLDKRRKDDDSPLHETTPDVVEEETQWGLRHGIWTGKDSKPFVVVSSNNRVEDEGWREAGDILLENQVISMTHIGAIGNMNPQKDTLKTYEAIAKHAKDFSLPYETLPKQIENNYKQIFVQKLHGSVPGSPEKHTQNALPSQTYQRYTENVPLTQLELLSIPDHEILNLQAAARLRKFVGDPRDSYSSRFEKEDVCDICIDGLQALDISVDTSLGPGFEDEGYGDSIEKISKRLSLVAARLYRPETRDSNKHFSVALQHLDKVFKRQLNQLNMTNKELEGVNKVIKQKNKSLETVVQSLAEEKEQLKYSLQQSKLESERLKNIYQEIHRDEDEFGRSKVIKIEELDELKGVAKGLKKRLELKRLVLREEEDFFNKLKTVTQDISNTFLGSNAKLRKLLKKNTPEALVRNFIEKETQSLTKTVPDKFYLKKSPARKAITKHPALGDDYEEEVELLDAKARFAKTSHSKEINRSNKLDPTNMYRGARSAMKLKRDEMKKLNGSTVK